MKIKDEQKIKKQKRVIEMQNDEIARLKEKIRELEISDEQKSAVIELADDARDEMDTLLEEINKYKQKYESILSELMDMRVTMEKMVFDGKYKKFKRKIFGTK